MLIPIPKIDHNLSTVNEFQVVWSGNSEETNSKYSMGI